METFKMSLHKDTNFSCDKKTPKYLILFTLIMGVNYSRAMWRDQYFNWVYLQYLTI